MAIVSFTLVVLLAFWLPGLYALHAMRLKLATPESFALPAIIGILLFTVSAYILSWAHAVILVLPIILLIDIQAIRQKLWKFGLEKRHVFPILFVIAASVLFSLPMMTTNITTNQAIYHVDDMLHLGYINELIHHFPPDHPGVAGIPLKGYHFFSDFLIAMLHNVFFLDVRPMFFHGIPLLTAILWGLGTYSLLFLWRNRIDTALWAVFLIFFGGSFGFLLRLTGHPDVSLRSTFGIDQPYSALLNPPYAISVALLLGALICAYEYLHTRKIGWFILMGLTAGLITTFKVYAGILVVAGFGFIILTDVLRKRFSSFWVAIGAAIIFFATYGVFSGRGAFLIWHPLWNTRSLLREGMPWYGYDEKLYTYDRFGMWWRIIGVELYGVFLYVFGNLGTRIIGAGTVAILWLTHRKPLSRFNAMLFLMTMIALIIPLFFIQSIKVFEIVQLAWYYPFFIALFAAAGLSWVVRKIPGIIGKSIIILIIAAATIPSTYENFIYTVYPTPRRIQTNPTTDPYFQVMQTLTRDPSYDATVLELPTLNTKSEYLDILAWYRTTLPYPAALGNKRSFFHSQSVDFPNIPLEERAKLIGGVLTLERMSGKEATFAATLSDIKSQFADHSIRYVISQFILTKLSPAHLIQISLPYYLYRIPE